MKDHAYRVLVVDDEAAMRKELEILLKEHGFQVECAADGEEGLKKLLTDEFDVTVVELGLPKMGGLEMIRRADAEDVDTYVIILTASGDKDDTVAALRLQRTVKDWFDKSSLNDEEFADRVRRVAEGVPLEYVRKILSKLPV